LTNPVIDFLLARRSAPIEELAGPPPSDADISTMLKVATRVPDHGRLAPWRFILYRPEAGKKIGILLAELAEKREGPLNEMRLEKERTRFSRAPLVIGVVSVPRDNPKIPKWEMELSGAAAAMNLVLAANALGYRTNWVTNWFAEDEEGRRILGLAPHEGVVGFIHVGRHDGELQDRPRPDPRSLVAEYSGPWEG
jgi:nitroreductase